jgi:alcohol oxidase
MMSYRGELSVGHPRFAEGSQAVSKPSAGPVAISAPNISYSAEDDEAIDIFHRENGLFIILSGWLQVILTVKLY